MPIVQWRDLRRESQRCNKGKEGREDLKQRECNAADNEAVLSRLEYFQ